MPGCDTQEHSLEMNLQRKIYNQAQALQMAERACTSKCVEKICQRETVNN